MVRTIGGSGAKGDGGGDDDDSASMQLRNDSVMTSWSRCYGEIDSNQSGA